MKIKARHLQTIIIYKSNKMHFFVDSSVLCGENTPGDVQQNSGVSLRSPWLRLGKNTILILLELEKRGTGGEE